MKKFTILFAVVIALLAGAVWWSGSLQSKNPDIISSRGIHWHATLDIYVNGEKEEIPPNLGLGAVHMPMHTHDTSGELHLEMPGIVRKDDLRLSEFFRIWGKDMNSFGENMKMTVSGVENTELGDYVMKDGDEIVLNYN